ncbi:MAG: hypothetical protein OEZ59_11725, partial [Deltaproteobacteria bacterium]|nr:hypothetical protein [Deltaproteobacteria bacterium]
MKTRKLTVIFIILILSVLPLSSCGDPSNEANVPLIPAEVLVHPTSELITSEEGATDSFSVVLGKVPAGVVTIGVVSEDESEVIADKASLEFTNENWETPQAVTLTGVDDEKADANQLVTIFIAVDSAPSDPDFAALDPADVSVTNLDNDEAGVTVIPAAGHITSENGTTSTFNVVLNTAPEGNVVIDLASGNTSEVTVDKTSLIFTQEQWQQPQTVTITGVDDYLADGDVQVVIALTINQRETIATTGYAQLDPQDVSVTNQDNDQLGITVTPTLGHITSEGGTTSTFEVVLTTAPDGNVVIDLTSGNTSEVRLDQSSLTFTPEQWQQPQTVTIAGVDDSMADGDANVLIALTVNQGETADSTGYAAQDPDDVLVVNQDNDEAGITVTPTLGHMTSEGATTSTFEVALATAPNGNVVIDLASGNTSEVTLDKVSLIFTPEQWQQPQTVTIAGVDDSMADGDANVLIALTVNQ